MTVPLEINGVTYEYPSPGDNEWGAEATDFASAVATGMLQKAGGLFQLLAEADFGTANGLKSLYLKSRSDDVASSGVIRLANNSDAISFRNAANSGNLDLKVNSSNQLLFNGVPVVGSAIIVNDTNSVDLTLSTVTLTADLKLSAASASASNQLVTLSIEADGIKGQITDARIVTGASTGVGYITNTMVNASAAIAFSKLATLTSGNVLVGSTGNVATSTAISGDISLSNTGATAYVGVVPLNKGGTGTAAASANAAFNALSPMTTGGDLIYGGASGVATRLGNENADAILKCNGTTVGPTWTNVIRMGIGTNSDPSYSFQSDTDTGIYSTGAGNLSFSSNGTRRLAMDAAGLDFVSSTSRITLDVYSDNGGLPAIRANNVNATANANTQVVKLGLTGSSNMTNALFVNMIDADGVTIGSISAASGTSVAFNTTSDQRLKTNIEDFAGLELNSKMRAVRYEGIKDPGITQYGFIAQEMYKVWPGIVHKGSEQVPMSMDYSRITAINTKAIQELLEKVLALEKKINQ